MVVGAGAGAALTVINEEWLSCSPALRGMWALQCQRNIPAPKPPPTLSGAIHSAEHSPGKVGGGQGGPWQSWRRRARRSRGHPTPCDLVIQPRLVCVLMGQDIHIGCTIKEWVRRRAHAGLCRWKEGNPSRQYCKGYSCSTCHVAQFRVVVSISFFCLRCF